MPTGVAGHVLPSAGQTEGEGEGVGVEEEMEEVVLEMMAVAEEEEGVDVEDEEEVRVLERVTVTEEGEGVEDEEEETVLERVAVTEEETTGFGEVEGFCTVMRVTFSTACRGKLALLPAKSLAVGGRSEKQPPETLGIPFVRVQSGL